MAQEQHEIRPALGVIVGANVYRLRTAHEPRLSQERLAALAGCTKETIRVVEGSRDPERTANSLRLDTLEGIAAALGVEPASLLEWDPEATRVFLQGRPPLSVIQGKGRSRSGHQAPLVSAVVT